MTRYTCSFENVFKGILSLLKLQKFLRCQLHPCQSDNTKLNLTACRLYLNASFVFALPPGGGGWGCTRHFARGVGLQHISNGSTLLYCRHLQLLANVFVLGKHIISFRVQFVLHLVPPNKQPVIKVVKSHDFSLWLSHHLSYFVTCLKCEFLDSVGKFRRGFNEKNLANFAKLSCTIKLRLCVNATLGRLYYFCTTPWLWRPEKFPSTLNSAKTLPDGVGNWEIDCFR